MAYIGRDGQESKRADAREIAGEMSEAETAAAQRGALGLAHAPLEEVDRLPCLSALLAPVFDPRRFELGAR
jgi:hypothetical protein